MITAKARPLDRAAGRPQRFIVSTGTMAHRFDAWCEILAGTVVPFDVRPTGNTSEGFRGVVEQRRFGELALIDCTFSPCVARRGQDLVDGGTNGERKGLLGIQLMQRGIEVTRDRRRGRATISPGQVVLWDSRRTVEVEALQAVRKRVLVLPQEVALSFCPRLAEQTVLPPIDRTAAGRLLVRCIKSLAGMREDIRHYIRVHLQDPCLGPASIARAYSMSVRALHGLFDDVEESVAGLVRAERLERCMQDLRRPDGGSVTTIAFRWGFSDSAHFSRVFKRTFGVTPSAVRRAAVEQDGS